MLDQSINIAFMIREIYTTLYNNIGKEFSKLELTVPQVFVMDLLYRHKKLKVNEISSEVNLTNATVSGILDRLEKQHMITRTRGEKDKRVVYIELTEHGNELAESFKVLINNYFTSLFEDCTIEDMENIITNLSLLKDIINKQGGQQI